MRHIYILYHAFLAQRQRGALEHRNNINANIRLVSPVQSVLLASTTAALLMFKSDMKSLATSYGPSLDQCICWSHFDATWESLVFLLCSTLQVVESRRKRVLEV